MYNQFMQIDPSDPIRKNRMSVKGFLGTSNALAIAILYTISTVMAFISSFLSSSTLTYIIEEFFDDALDINLRLPDGIGTLFSIPVLPILTLVAFYLLFAAGKNNDPDKPNSAGAVMLLVVSIIELVKFALIVIAVLILFIYIIASVASVTSYTSSAVYDLDSYYSFGFINGYIDDSAASVVGILGILILLGALALGIIYHIGMIKFSSSLRKGLSGTENLSSKGAKAVGVCYIFFAIFNGLSVLYTFLSASCSLANTSYYYYSNYEEVIIGQVLNIIVSVITFVISICMAKFAFSYNNHVRAENLKSYNYSVPQPEPVYNNFSAPAATPMHNAPAEPPVYNAPVDAPVYQTPAEVRPQQTTNPVTTTNPIESLYYSKTTLLNEEPDFAPKYDSEETTFLSQNDLDFPDGGETTFLDESEVTGTPGSICPICGCQVASTQAFCAECGYKLK